MAGFLRKLKLFLLLPIISGVILNVECAEEKKPKKRSYSVADAHVHGVVRESRYGFSGEHRFVAERRLSDGTVEGESLYIRPDGVPIKVHYFGDGRGQRPKVEVGHKEQHITTGHHLPHGHHHVPAVPTVVERRVVVPEVRQVVDVIAPPPSAVVVPPPRHHPAVVVAPPRAPSGVNIVDARTGQGVSVGSNGGDVAAAVPSVTAVIGPGAHAVIQPEAEAHSANGAAFRTIGGGGGDVSVANPQVTAIAGAGSSVVIAPKARATSGGIAPPPVIRDVHHVPPPHHVIAPPPPAAIQRVIPVHTAAVPLAPPPTVHHVVAAQPHPARVIVPGPTITAVRAAGVVVVPPKPSYSYTYSYSAPDGKHPQRDNSAYVNVQVNQ